MSINSPSYASSYVASSTAPLLGRGCSGYVTGPGFILSGEGFVLSSLVFRDGAAGLGPTLVEDDSFGLGFIF